MNLERDKLYKDNAGIIWRVVCVDYSDRFGPCIAVVESSPIGVIYTDWCHSYLPGGMCAAERNGEEYGKHPNDLMSEYRKPREFTIRVFDNGLIGDTDAGSINNSTSYEEIKVREVCSTSL